MIDWQTQNQAYLSQRLAWLRDLLARSGRNDSKPEFDWDPANVDTEPSSDLAALEQIRNCFGLSEFETDLLFLGAAFEFDTGLPRLCAEAQGDTLLSYPTLALALKVFNGASWDALSPHRPLIKHQLIQFQQPLGQPLLSSPVRTDQRIVSFIKGLNYLDERLARLLLLLADRSNPKEIWLSPSQQETVSELGAAIPRLTELDGRPPLIQLVGSDEPSKLQVAESIAHNFGLDLYSLSSELIPLDISEQELFLRLWERESCLLPMALYIEPSTTLDQMDPASPISRFLRRSSGLVFISVSQASRALTRRTEVMEITKPSPSEQRQLWTELLRDPVAAQRLSAQFNFDGSAIHTVARRAEAPSRARPSGERKSILWNLCRRHARPALDELAERIDCRATWNDLILPDEPTRELRAITSQLRRADRVYQEWGFAKKHVRGLGTSVLFSGESGTGKTMAAEVIANDLELDLYRIDLSQVVNKYIGETEKNLKRIFDLADGNVILFFDEADALFGKRTQVKDAHDRFANIETNYLLQRMEAYRGLAILATNLKSSLDRAFLRRLRFVVNFAVPDARLRREIWERAFPADTPMGDVDFGRLARLNLTGGNIHTVALNAAFTSSGDEAVSMASILNSAQQEYRKLQKPICSNDFQWRNASSRNSSPRT